MKTCGFLLIILSTLVLGACSPTPSKNNNKSTDDDGAFLHGKGAPTNSLGSDYSHYYDEDSRYVWEKNNGEWVNQFTIGSDSLYTEKSLTRAAHNKEKISLINAIATSFYSTNATCQMIPHFPDSETQGWDLLVKYNKRDIMITSTTEGAFANPYYVRMDSQGKAYLYSGGEYRFVDNDNLYCMLPHPTIETIAYENYLIYDDDLGQQTSIIAAYINTVTYDEESGFYSIKNMRATHSPMTTHYFHTPGADSLVLDFDFKLSRDKTYVDQAFFKIVSSES